MRRDRLHEDGGLRSLAGSLASAASTAPGSSPLTCASCSEVDVEGFLYLACCWVGDWEGCVSSRDADATYLGEGRGALETFTSS